MDSCNRIRKYLPEFIEGELEAGLKKEVEEHLRACAGCRKEKEVLDKSWALLGKWPSIEPSPDFRIRFWDRVDNMGRQRRVILPAPFSRRLVPVLACLFILILGISIFIKPKIEQINLVNEIDNMEFYQNMEVIQNLDLLSDMEIFMEQDEYNG